MAQQIKKSACNAGDTRDVGSDPGSGRSPGGRHGNPLQCSCLENPHRQKSLAGYSPWGHKESDNDWAHSTAFTLHSFSTHRLGLTNAWSQRLQSRWCLNCDHCIMLVQTLLVVLQSTSHYINYKCAAWSETDVQPEECQSQACFTVSVSSSIDSEMCPFISLW